jgi:hypothetical protein
MSDLDVVTGLRPDVALPTIAELAGARRKLVEAIDAELASARPEAATPATNEPLPRPSLRRRRRIALAGMAAAAAAAAAFLAIPTTARSARPSSPVIDLTAARFLDRAASAVVNEPAAAPQPGQFVYSETQTADGTVTETWLSADGSSDGLTRWTSGSTQPGNSGGNGLGPPCSIAQAEATKCFPTVGYFPDLPTDPNAVLPYLNEIGVVDTADGPPSDAPAGWEDNVIGKAVSYLMSSSYLLPTQQAALYKLMAETPGFEMVPSMADAVGRTGVGIEWTFEGGTAAVIFDPTTFAYLGERTWPEAQPADPDATYDGAALVKLAVVSSAGQRP